MKFGIRCTHEILEAKNGWKKVIVFAHAHKKCFFLVQWEIHWKCCGSANVFSRALPNVFSGARKHNILAGARMPKCKSPSRSPTCTCSFEKVPRGPWHPFGAKEITESISIPTIGIGSSINCDGQILVINDILNTDDTFKKPQFVKTYANFSYYLNKAVKRYDTEVKNRKFPKK